MASKLHSSGFIKGPNGQLYFEREGNLHGQSILFVHGLGGTTNAYQTLVPELQDYDLVRFDWSGHGRSSVTPRTSISTYVDDCKAVIDHLNLNSVLVVGHSLGGLISLHLASQLQQKVKAMLLLGPVRPPSVEGQKGINARAQAVREGGMAAVTDIVVSNAFSATSLRLLRGEVALAREMLTRQDPEAYALAVEALGSSVEPQWSNITAKTVILSGEEDKVSTVAMGRLIVDDVEENATQLTLPGVGHWHMLEAPFQCVEAIKKLAE